MGLPANPIGAAISGKLPVAQTALPPNPLKGLVSAGVTPVPSAPTPPAPHVLPPGGLEQLQHQTQVASAPAAADFSHRAGAQFHDVPVGWKPEDIKAIHDAAAKNPQEAEFWGSLVSPLEWAKQAVAGAKQLGHGVTEVAHGKLGHGAEDIGLGGLSAAAILPMGRGAKALREVLGATVDAGGVEARLARAGFTKSEINRGLTAASRVADLHAHDPEQFSRVVGKAAKIANRKGISAKYSAEVPQALSRQHAFGQIVREALDQKAAAEAPHIPEMAVPVGAHGAPPAADHVAPEALPAEASPAAVHEPVGLAARIGHAILPSGSEAGAARTPEEAHSHLLEAAAQARAEGLTAEPGGKGHPPVVERGVVHEPTGGELGMKIREALVHAPAIRAEQKASGSEELTARVRAASEAKLQAGGGTAGRLATKRHLRGELPKEFFGHLKDFTPEDLHQAEKVIDTAPLQFFEKTHAGDALEAMVNDGVVPNKSDHALLERVFGRVAGAPAPDEKAASFWDKFVGALNIPRAIRSSGDISAGLRQGLVVLVTHPRVFWSEWKKQIRSFGSEEFYQAQQAAIHNDPLYPLMHKYGVPFTDIGGNVPGQEEAFVGSQAAEHIPLAGHVVRASDRAFTGFQNGTRAELFKIMVEKAAGMGHDFTNANPGSQHLGESIARVVGSFTGRGVVPKMLEGHLTTMNAAMFSPRLMASRMNLLSPVYYAKLDPFARREALAGARNLVAAIGATMMVAKLLGATVNFDPRSSNFAKIKVGNTRIDIAGGFSQYVRFMAQEMTREAISSAGHKAHIGWGQHDISDLANTTKLFRSKAAPIPSLAWDEASGKDFIGQPVKQGHELWSNAPFVAQDTVDAYQKSGPQSVAIAAFLSAIGLGVQSYKDKPQGRPTPKGGGAGLPSLPPLPDLPALPRTP